MLSVSQQPQHDPNILHHSIESHNHSLDSINLQATLQIHDQVQDLLLAHKVIQSGIPNRFGCRIPVRSGFNINLLTEWLKDYHDREVVEWLEFGFSVSRDTNYPDPMPATINHSGANMFPEAIQDYLETEISLGATLGPFSIPPFISRIGVSPLNTRPKRDSVKRRVILDLCFPHGESVNDGIQKDQYCGQPIKLKYPTVDQMAS